MRINNETVEKWRIKAIKVLAEYGYTLEDVKTMSNAWYVAHKMEIPKEAYSIGKDIQDSHIETALCKIFPHVTKKVSK